MTDHKPMPVKGYNPQNDSNVAKVNANKIMEEKVLRVLDTLKDDPDIDQRWLAIGRTNIEQGFMAVNRSAFKPGRVPLERE